MDNRINTLQSEYRLYMESAANETKSTAGDKHDTSKSMMQLEQEKLSAQLNQLKEQKKVLSQVDFSQKFKKVGFGSLVKTNQGNFFISISSRPIEISREIFNCISVLSPIGRLMLNKLEGSEIKFMDKAYKILEIY